MKKELILFFVLLAVLCSALANIGQGADNNCEELAKEYQNIHGGSMVFIQPILSNGAYDFGRYKGHWINSVYNKSIKAQGRYYYDVYSGSIMISEEEVKDWYGSTMEMWDLEYGYPPFPLIRN